MKTLKKFKGQFDLSNKNTQAIKGGMPGSLANEHGGNAGGPAGNGNSGNSGNNGR